ncbi:uncharacterized protein LOC136075911 [Hydra vulgaris]|uniref:Uncharacterized protein LOC136075911 n=1 Tax=Hydra vulgaris TaxID=6087 RepID=A0ABM4B967_HYDVU
MESPESCVMHQVERDITHNGERYITKLPFKTEHDPLSDTYNICKKRLANLKKRLKKTIGKAFLSNEELETILCEIESVINSRPLYYISEDDTKEALTPYHLIFATSYLNELKQHHLYFKDKTSYTEQLVANDVVLIRDDTKIPRIQWRMGKVLKLIRGIDGKVRGAHLQILSKEGI